MCNLFCFRVLMDDYEQSFQPICWFFCSIMALLYLYDDFIVSISIYVIGPAGTGKTESVKALGHQMGRFVLVFNCDETFDFQAMGRIFVGLCQVGAWGCFDEFNRLEERMLSAVSQQIQTIQETLKEHGEQQSKICSKVLQFCLALR